MAAKRTLREREDQMEKRFNRRGRGSGSSSSSISQEGDWSRRSNPLIRNLTPVTGVPSPLPRSINNFRGEGGLGFCWLLANIRVGLILRIIR